MNKGVLIYAHNSRKIDYLELAIISGSFAKKILNLPVSLVTDRSTMNWAVESKKDQELYHIFDKIIFSEDYFVDSSRKLYDGLDHKEDVPFLNGNRYSAWDLTPYDHTLLIDSDYLVMSDSLNEYWHIDCDFMISSAADDITPDSRLGYNDRYISEVGIKMRWATTIMFRKTAASKIIFDTVEFIRKNYVYFADLYRFDHRVFRNDIAFSIALHMTSGHKDSDQIFLPPIPTTISKDVLVEVKNKKLFFLISSIYENSYSLCSIDNHDIHVMNKQSLIRNKNKLMEMI